MPAILLIDMDAFHASVEQARRTEVAGLPVAIGGEPRREPLPFRIERASRSAASGCSLGRADDTGAAVQVAPAELDAERLQRGPRHEGLLMGELRRVACIEDGAV